MHDTQNTAQTTKPRQMTYLSLPVDLRRVAKAQACLRGQTLAEYVAELLAADLRDAGMIDLTQTQASQSDPTI